MWTFLAALAGGLVALLGSIGTTWYVQRQAIKAERRARATRAADEILATVTTLRELPAEPETESQQRREWSGKRQSLLYRVMAQIVLISEPGVQERLRIAAQAMFYDNELEPFITSAEIDMRDALCMEILDCLGAFLQGRPLPPERKATTRARTAIEQGLNLEDI